MQQVYRDFFNQQGLCVCVFTNVVLVTVCVFVGDYAGFPGCGLLRLHSTYRHDLKIYASDEGRVQMTAAAFAKVCSFLRDPFSVDIYFLLLFIIIDTNKKDSVETLEFCYNHQNWYLFHKQLQVVNLYVYRNVNNDVRIYRKYSAVKTSWNQHPG